MSYAERIAAIRKNPDNAWNEDVQWLLAQLEAPVPYVAAWLRDEDGEWHFRVYENGRNGGNE